MNAPTTETAKKPYISVVTDCHVYDDYAEGPSFVVIQFDEDDIKKIKAYREAMNTMREQGLDPFKISSFSHNAMFLDPINAQPLNEADQKSLRFLSDDVKAEWEDRFEDELEEGDEYSSIWELEGEHRIETDMINITDMGISITAYLKHIDVRIESDVLYEKEFQKIEKWVEELNA